MPTDSSIPSPAAAVPGELPFGLTVSALRPTFAAAGCDSTNPNAAEILVSGMVGGVGGTDARLVTVQWPSGPEVELFVKRNRAPERHEAARYHALGKVALPLPRLLQAIINGDDEVLVLERLERVGIERTSTSEVHRLLDLIATLNSSTVPNELATAPPGMPADQFDQLVAGALEQLAADPESPIRPDVARWFEAYRRSIGPVDRMPTALCHGELYFQQVGWQWWNGQRRLTLFDLETLAYRPRFIDVGSVLSALSIDSGHSETELFRHYLRTLARIRGSDLELDACLTELRILRWHQSCCALPWLVRQHACQPSAAPLAATLRCMVRDLPIVEHECPIR